MADSRFYEFEGRSPTVDGNAHVARGATLVGDVTVESNAIVWPGAVIRGDVEPITVGRGSDIRENTSLHAADVGERAMVSQGAVVNEATVEDGALVGFNATVSHTDIGEGSVVGTGAVVHQGQTVPPGTFAFGVPARVVPIEETALDPAGLYEAYHSGDYDNLGARHAELFASGPAKN
jgi:carbonic anhydrase/acetyltransferase-like protein (isoleucine patch superfamily)